MPSLKPKWADKMGKTTELCDCGARCAITVCPAKTKEGEPIHHLVCTATGWMPENCTIAHPEKVVHPIAPNKVAWI